MSSPRVRRLQSDYQRVRERFQYSSTVRLDLTEGIPPDLYRIRYRLKGLYATSEGQILEREEHLLEIRLGLEYPRRAPQLRMLTAVFHPNFNETEVCAQDFYAASEGLDDLIIRIGRMLAYQEYNTKSPLNGIAARWAEENASRLPVDPREVAPPPLETVSRPQPQAPPPPPPPPAREPELEQLVRIGEVLPASTPPPPPPPEPPQRPEPPERPEPTQQQDPQESAQRSEPAKPPQPGSERHAMTCPNCGAALRIPTEYLRVRGKCRHCQAYFVPADHLP